MESKTNGMKRVFSFSGEEPEFLFNLHHLLPGIAFSVIKEGEYNIIYTPERNYKIVFEAGYKLWCYMSTTDLDYYDYFGELRDMKAVTLGILSLPKERSVRINDRAWFYEARITCDMPEDLSGFLKKLEEAMDYDVKLREVITSDGRIFIQILAGHYYRIREELIAELKEFVLEAIKSDSFPFHSLDLPTDTKTIPYPKASPKPNAMETYFNRSFIREGLDWPRDNYFVPCNKLFSPDNCFKGMSFSYNFDKESGKYYPDKMESAAKFNFESSKKETDKYKIVGFYSLLFSYDNWKYCRSWSNLVDAPQAYPFILADAGNFTATIEHSETLLTVTTTVKGIRSIRGYAFKYPTIYDEFYKTVTGGKGVPSDEDSTFAFQVKDCYEVLNNEHGSRYLIHTTSISPGYEIYSVSPTWQFEDGLDCLNPINSENNKCRYAQDSVDPKEAAKKYILGHKKP